MVPGGNLLWGWKKMMDCLDKIVGRKPVRRIADQSFITNCKETNTRESPVKQVCEDFKSWKKKLKKINKKKI